MRIVTIRNYVFTNTLQFHVQYLSITPSKNVLHDNKETLRSD